MRALPRREDLAWVPATAVAVSPRLVIPSQQGLSDFSAPLDDQLRAIRRKLWIFQHDARLIAREDREGLPPER